MPGETNWKAEAVAAFDGDPSSRYHSLFPCVLYLERVHDGDPEGYTPPEPVELPFYRCRRCDQGGGVRWLRSRFSPTNLALCHLICVELEHDFDCTLCGTAETKTQFT